jgi:DNA-directed RNA polymerase specialized sigma24 family protein
MPLIQPDPGVLRKAQRGDERAFTLIVRAYETPVYNYVVRLIGGDRVLAEDLTQEVFLLFRGSSSPSARSSDKLFRVTKNRVLDELRANERRPRLSVALGHPAARGRDARSGTGDGRRVALRREPTPDLKMACFCASWVSHTRNCGLS